MPDINSLPSPPSSTGSPATHDERRPALASAVGRARGGSGSPRMGRRPSAVMMNLALGDDSLPGPGELQTGGERPRRTSFRAGSPRARVGASGDIARHERAPSLGELHQELEQEQEAQVNRLLHMIGQQQEQIRQTQQAADGASSEAATAVADDSTPTSERSFQYPSVSQQATTINNPRSRSPAPQSRHRPSLDLRSDSHRRSLTPSRTGSPSSRPTSAGWNPYAEGIEQGWLAGGSRGDAEFFSAETQMLTRENQMLRIRIRELERQVSDLNTRSSAAATPATPSTTPSNLAGSVITAEVAPARSSEGAVPADDGKPPASASA